MKRRHGIVIQRIKNSDAPGTWTFIVQDTELSEKPVSMSDELTAWMRFDEMVAEKLRRTRGSSDQ